MRLRAKIRSRLGWDEWWSELKRLAATIKWPIQDCESWRAYWKDGYAPAEALAEDIMP